MFNTTIATQIYAKICFEATNSQKKIIENLSEYLSGDDFSRIFVLNGFAGTGKTTLIAAVVAALKELRIKPVLLAPTYGNALQPGKKARKSVYRNEDSDSGVSGNGGRYVCP